MFKSARWLLLGLALGALTYWTIQQRLVAPQNTVAVTEKPSSTGTLTIPSKQVPPPETVEVPAAKGSARRDVSQNSKSASDAKWLAFLQSFDRGAEWKLRRDDRGRMVIVSGGFARLPQNRIKDAAEWAVKVAEFSGVPAEQVLNDGRQLPETDFSRTYNFPQAFQGYEVVDSFIRVFERKSDGVIYYTAMELEDIGPPDLRMVFSVNQAEAAGLQYFAKFKSVEAVKPLVDKPLIFATAPGNSELVWPIVFKINSDGYYDERQLLISAVSGRPLRDLRVLVH